RAATNRDANRKLGLRRRIHQPPDRGYAEGMPQYLQPDDDIPVVDTDPFADPPPGPSATVIGLALLPLGIPVLWLIAPQVVGREPLFSIALPLAIAAAAAGLAVGAAIP